jgi:hypothetical protein
MQGKASRSELARTMRPGLKQYFPSGGGESGESRAHHYRLPMSLDFGWK